MDFSERLELLMKEKGKTKIETANCAGISTQTFYDWKKKGSMPAADVAIKIARFLGTTVEYLITGTETTEENSQKKYADLKSAILEAIQKIDEE